MISQSPAASILRTKHIAAVAAALLPCLAATAASAAGSVNVYSYREPKLIQPLVDAFKAETGIDVNLVFAKDGLIERMEAEGQNSPADVLLTNESGLLVLAKARGVTQPLTTEAVKSAVPEALRDPDAHWFALTRRARVLYFSKERIKDSTFDYEDLADPKWNGKICMRSGQHTYSVALVASMIKNIGLEKAEAWLTGVKSNLARKPAGGDREAVRDVQAGLCDIAVGNTYYMAAMLKNPEQKAWAEAVRIVFPNADDRGTHVNVSGMALAKAAPNRANAEKFMTFLVSPAAQKIYADSVYEYPVLAGVEPSDTVKSWGELKPDPTSIEELATLRTAASELVDKVQFDAGPGS